MSDFYLEFDSMKLREPCTSINIGDSVLLIDLYNSLRNTLIYLGGGSGLAAPQIGIHKRAFIWTKDRDIDTIKMAVNPIVKPDKESSIIKTTEACFSIPLKFFEVNRYKRIYFEYFSLKGKKVSTIVEGFEAVVVQHEYDHLQENLISCKGKLLKSFEEKSKDYEEFLKNYRNKIRYE